MENCVFCEIVYGRVSTPILLEDDRIIAFKDIKPVTPVHILVIPKKHIASLEDIEMPDVDLLGHMVNSARELAKQNHLDQSGYRLVINTGPDAGQSVFHLHLHLLGGRKMPFRFE